MLLALLAVALLEASNAATGVKNLLLAGVERVALRAHAYLDVKTRCAAAGDDAKEWGRRGLNPGPGDYESHALTD